MPKARFIAILLGACLLWASCTADCITCANVEGYPNGTICRDTYETTLVEGTPDWKTYAGEGLTAGCTEAE